MLNPDVRELLASGVVIYVATRDAALEADIAFGMGVHVPDPGTIVVYLPTGESAEAARRNIAANGQVAVSFTRPSDDRSVQIKGTARAVRDADGEDRLVQEVYRGALTEQFALVGIPRSVSRRLRTRPAVAVEVEVRAVYEQTPGPGAGARITG